jgi:hypothetical protein
VFRRSIGRQRQISRKRPLAKTTTGRVDGGSGFAVCGLLSLLHTMKYLGHVIWLFVGSASHRPGLLMELRQGRSGQELIPQADARGSSTAPLAVLLSEMRGFLLGDQGGHVKKKFWKRV